MRIDDTHTTTAAELLWPPSRAYPDDPDDPLPAEAGAGAETLGGWPPGGAIANPANASCTGASTGLAGGVRRRGRRGGAPER